MTDEKKQLAGLYVHIPFCEMRCHYCDFLTFAHVSAGISDYLVTLYQEIASAKADPQLRQLVFDTIYLGGGTPSLLDCDQLETLFQKIRENISIAPDAEISIECNPNTLSREKAACMKRLGINRISLAVQSFDDDLLRLCGRNHTAAVAKRDFQMLREVGFDDISLDMMLAIPGQTPAQLTRDVEAAIALAPEHISYYSLILEERTRFWLWHAAGKLPLVPEDQERAYFHRVEALLTAAGYDRYEISNFAKAGYESKHNKKYWTFAPYWGAGLGAASFVDGERYTNERTLRDYRARVNDGVALAEKNREVRDESDAIFEYVMLATRLIDGFERADFMRRFGFDFVERYQDVLQPQIARGLLEVGARVRLTERGLDLQNDLLSDLLLAMDARAEENGA